MAVRSGPMELYRVQIVFWSSTRIEAHIRYSRVFKAYRVYHSISRKGSFNAEWNYSVIETVFTDNRGEPLIEILTKYNDRMLPFQRLTRSLSCISYMIPPQTVTRQ